MFKTNAISYIVDIGSGIKNVGNISIAGFFLLLQMFILVATPYIFPGENMSDVFIIYFIMMVMSYTVLNKTTKIMQISLKDGAAQISLFFLGGVFLFSAITNTRTVPNFAGFGSIMLLTIAQILVVASAEETTFRGALPRILDESGASPRASRLLSAVGFASFHMFIYAFDMVLLFIAFIFGLTMQYVWDGGDVESKTKGYPLGAVGLHAAWNVVVIAGPIQSIMSFDFMQIFGGLL